MKVLVVRVGRIGDLVMITPAFDALLERYPGAEFTLLTSPEGRRVFRGFDPRLADIWIHSRKALLPFLARAKLRRALRAAGFDEVYLFESHPTFDRLLAGTIEPDRVVRLPKHPGPSTTHYAQKCLELVEPSGRALPRWVRLPVSDAARAQARGLLARAGIEGVNGGTFLVGFHPGFAEHGRWIGGAEVRRNKCWPVARWGELAHGLVAEATRQALPLRIVMDLMPEDRELGESIVAASGGVIRLLVPPPDFERYKATLAELDLFVAPDTGPMHVAAAVGTPVVALFHGKDPADCGPFTDAKRHAAVRAEESPGAARLGLAALEVERVLDACRRFLADNLRCDREGS